ncbi:MAG: HAD-IA family hydrolase [Anaerolineae bacterium]
MIDVLIWDAGGTLFDTYPAVVWACRRALQTFGYDAKPTWLLGLFRQTTVYALQVVADRYGLDGRALAAQFSRAYDAVEPERQPPFPGVKDVCSYVCESGGENYIVTHRGRDSLMKLLAAHRMTNLFTDCITKEDPYPRKPDPASLLALMRRHVLDPERCMAIGDRPLDIVAGRRAGIITCAFGEEAGDEGADLVINHFHELLHWLRRQTRGEGTVA